MGERKSRRNCVGESQLDEMGYVQKRSVWRVMDMPARLRPREAMERLGVENTPDEALLAIVLRTGAQGINVVDLATSLAHNYGSLTALAEADVEDLVNIKGIGPVKAQILKAALELGRRIQAEKVDGRTHVRTPEDVVQILGPEARTLDHEVFWIIHLDARNRLEGRPSVVSHGLLDSSLVHPREVFRRAVRKATAGIVLAHNHPSGDPTPSAEDIRITRQLIDAGRIMEITVLDHIIIGKTPHPGGRHHVSLREEGIVEFGGNKRTGTGR